MKEFLVEFIQSTGFVNLDLGQSLVILISCVLLYLGIYRKYEPLLLVPIAFGMLLANLPLSGSPILA